MATVAATDEKRVYRAREGAFVGGVCAGIAERYELDAIVVRILAVLLTLLTLGLALVAYAVLWAQLPLEPEEGGPFDITPESAESSAFGCVDCSARTRERDADGVPLLARLAIAAGLVVLFLVVSNGISPIFLGTQWWQFWPIAFVIAGLCLIIVPARTSRAAVWHAAGVVLAGAAASMLPMSLGVMSWHTIGCSFAALWPAVVIAVALFAAGLARNSGALMLSGAFCFVAFCLTGIVLCAVPGDLGSLLLHMPSGRSYTIIIG